MLASVFIGTSLDGFIARRNGEYDFLPADGGEPHGYTEFMAGIDTLVIGRKTFETVVAFAEWPYARKRVVVLSSRALDLSKVGMGGRHARRTAGKTPAGSRRTSSRSWKRAGRRVFMWMAGTRSSAFCGRG